MSTRILAITFATIGLAALTGPAAACPEAASFALETSGGTSGSFGGNTPARGQTFTPTCSGRLATVSLRIGQSADHTGLLRVAVQELDGGGLPGATLAVGEFSFSELPQENADAHAFDLSASLAELQAGQEYVVTVVPTEISEEANFLALNGSFGESATYEEGLSLRQTGTGIWVASDQIDWAFAVTLEEDTPVAAATWGGLKASRYRPHPRP